MSDSDKPISSSLRQASIHDFKRYFGQMTSLRHDWATPKTLFGQFDQEFGFTLDAAASDRNAKCDRFFTKEQDALSLPWQGRVHTAGCTRPGLARWIEKGFLEVAAGNAQVVVFLVPARTDTIWWHEYAMRAREIRFLKGRIRFDDGPNRATFPSVAIVFGGVAG